MLLLAHRDERAMPGVGEDLTGESVYAEHAADLTGAFRVQSVVTIELICVFFDLGTRQVRIQIVLRQLDRLVGANWHFC